MAENLEIPVARDPDQRGKEKDCNVARANGRGTCAVSAFRG